MKFILTDNEKEALIEYKKHCEYTSEYIESILAQKEIGSDCDEIGYVVRDNTQGIELRADWNVMHNEIRKIKALGERYEAYQESFEEQTNEL